MSVSTESVTDLHDTILNVRDVRLSFGGLTALDGPTFQIRRGEVCGLIGPNGAGKTTLFNCISRLYQPDSGQITLRDVDLLSLRTDEIAGHGIARTFQHVGLMPTMTVLDNVVTGAYHRTRAGFWSSALGLPSARREERRELVKAAELLDELDLASVAGAFPAGLPYGTLKRIELARALMCEPELLLLDEPANGLIHEEVNELAELIKRLSRERNLAVLLVEHHMAMVMGICDFVVVLNFGQVIAQGTPAHIQQDPAVIEAYLGGDA